MLASVAIPRSMMAFLIEDDLAQGEGVPQDVLGHGALAPLIVL